MDFLDRALSVMRWMAYNIAKPIFFGRVALFYLFVWVLVIALIVSVTILCVRYYKLSKSHIILKDIVDCRVKELSDVREELLVTKEALTLKNAEVEALKCEVTSSKVVGDEESKSTSIAGDDLDYVEEEITK